MDDTVGDFRRNIDILRENWGWFLALGIGLIVLGMVSIGTPLIATLAIEIMVGVLLLIGGILTTFHAFQSRRWGKFLLEVLGGVLYLGIGILLLVYPLTGMLSLTFLLSIFLLVSGVIKTTQAFQMRPTSNWGWILLSGIVSIVLGVIIWAGLPVTALWAVGLIVGIDFLFSGFSMVMISVAARSATRRGRTYCIGGECFTY